MNKILMMGVFTGAMVFSLPASADGQLNFKGNIVSAPCNLSMAQANQTIDMGAHEREQKEVPFSITFTDCTATPAKISFSGRYEGDEFKLLTSTEGLALTLVVKESESGSTLIPMDGTKSPLPDFVEGNNTVNFNTYVNSVDWSAVAPGLYTTSAEFTMHYE